jgi:shikimate dehydrogenase
MIYSGSTVLTGLIGWPVAHSLSPRLHGYWLRENAIDGAYLPLPVQASDLGTAVLGLRAAGFRGVNVTVPHKQGVFALCDEVDDAARAAGAVNTMVFGGRRVLGCNTDGAGFLASLVDAGVDPAAGPALILGAGGAARAIAAALLGAGARVTVTSRTVADAAALAAQVPGVATLSWSEAPALGRLGLLVNATAGGMQGKAELSVDLGQAPAGLVVADIVYAPRETALLRQAGALGLRRVEGVGMLLHQAALAFQAWFGVLPKVDAAVRDFLLPA